MQSSSTATLAGIAVLLALVIAYFPILLTPDALAQSVTFPSPVLGSLASSTLSAMVVATSSAPKTSSVAIVTKVVATDEASVTYPRLVIPSLDLNDPIVPEGVDSTGAMEVPNGKTDDVGSYDAGPQPGQEGSAVLDAHVFAAFSKLDELKAGDSIYVEMSATTTLQFVVTKTVDFPLSQITSQDLFVPTTDRDLNLVTCAGKLIDNNTTYDHRLVVYSTLAN